MNLRRASPPAAAVPALFVTTRAGPDMARGAATQGVQLQKAVEAPLSDLKLVQETMPALRDAAVKAPCAPPSTSDGLALAAEVGAPDGAERHSKAVAAAIAAGSVRRDFLEGVGQALGCAAPAAPRQALAAAAAPFPAR